MAAAIVVGHNFNRWRAWKNVNGQYIDVYREEYNSEDENDDSPFGKEQI